MQRIEGYSVSENINTVKEKIVSFVIPNFILSRIFMSIYVNGVLSIVYINGHCIKGQGHCLCIHFVYYTLKLYTIMPYPISMVKSPFL